MGTLTFIGEIHIDALDMTEEVEEYVMQEHMPCQTFGGMDPIEILIILETFILSSKE